MQISSAFESASRAACSIVSSCSRVAKSLAWLVSDGHGKRKCETLIPVMVNAALNTNARGPPLRGCLPNVRMTAHFGQPVVQSAKCDLEGASEIRYSARS